MATERDDAIRIAQGLLRDGRRTIGLLAAPRDVEVEPTAIAVGFALSMLKQGNVVLIDLGARWRTAPRTTVPPSGSPPEGRRPQPRASGSPSEGRRSQLRASDGGIMNGRWVASSVAVLAPREPPETGRAIALLRRALDDYRERAAFVLVDLSSLDPRGEGLQATLLLDGVCVVGRAGRTRERDLIGLCRELLPSKDLGVLLTAR